MVLLLRRRAFCQSAPLAALAEMVHKKGLNVTTYTGYTFEQLLEMKNSDIQHLLTQTDILIDGKFDITQKIYLYLSAEAKSKSN